MAVRQDASTGQLVDDGSTQIQDNTNAMHVKVYSPFKTYYDGLAESISADNDTGPFDILYGHRNFLTLLKAGEIVIRNKDRDDEKIPISRGLMHVQKNQVIVFLDV